MASAIAPSLIRCVCLSFFLLLEGALNASIATRQAYKEACDGYFQDVGSSRSLLGQTRNELYFLAVMGRERDKNKALNVYRYFKLSEDPIQIDKIFEITAGQIDYIISQSDPFMGIMLVDQKDERNNCNAGIADYLFLSLRKYRTDWQGQHTISGRDFIAPIKTAEGYSAFSVNEGSFMLFDPSSMQKRMNAALVGSKEAIQFINTPSRPTSNYVTLIDDKESQQRGLVHYRSSDRGSRKLPLTSNERLIRYQSFVATALFNQVENKIRLTFKPRWSHLPAQSSYIVDVSRSQLVGKARYMIDKSRMHLIVVGGGAVDRGKDDQIVRVYDILRNKLLSYYKVPLGSSIGFVNLIPDSGHIVVESLNRDGFSDALFYTNVKAGWQWRKVKIPRD